ncbi:MAG: hypothetical protein HY906_08935 [Deltaproteobacteria bacterium]|nr:hypothetical protein [Deltaproteobacteria bacterium]
MRTTAYLFTALVLVLAMGACQSKTPLGQERADYGGLWTGSDGSNIQLWADGTGDYKSGSTKVSGAAAKFDGNTLTIKMMGIGKTWTITTPPTQKGEKTVMVLDGVEYVKQKI